MPREVALDLLESVGRELDPVAVLEQEATAEPAAEDVGQRVAGDRAQPHQRDQRHELNLSPVKKGDVPLAPPTLRHGGIPVHRTHLE